jgi:hypothetical protein
MILSAVGHAISRTKKIIKPSEVDLECASRYGNKDAMGMFRRARIYFVILQLAVRVSACGYGGAPSHRLPL